MSIDGSWRMQLNIALQCGPVYNKLLGKFHIWSSFGTHKRCMVLLSFEKFCFLRWNLLHYVIVIPRTYRDGHDLPLTDELFPSVRSKRYLDFLVKMTTLDDKLLGLKSQNYVSSSESEGEDEDEKSSGEDNGRDDKIDLGGVAAPPDFRLEVPKVSILLSMYKFFLFHDCH